MSRQRRPSCWPPVLAATLAAGLAKGARQLRAEAASRSIAALVRAVGGRAGAERQRLEQVTRDDLTRGQAARADATAAERRAAFAADSSVILASSLDYEATLRRVAGLAVRVLADWCTVYMLGDGGEVRRVAVGYVGRPHAELSNRW